MSKDTLEKYLISKDKDNQNLVAKWGQWGGFRGRGSTFASRGDWEDWGGYRADWGDRGGYRGNRGDWGGYRGDWGGSRGGYSSDRRG